MAVVLSLLLLILSLLLFVRNDTQIEALIKYLIICNNVVSSLTDNPKNMQILLGCF